MHIHEFYVPHMDTGAQGSQKKALDPLGWNISKVQKQSKPGIQNSFYQKMPFQFEDRITELSLFWLHYGSRILPLPPNELDKKEFQEHG